MDDVLQRMLRVEREAEGVTAEAEAEAERILQSGRRKAADLEAERLREVAEQAQAVVTERVQAAEEKRDAALATSRQHIEQRQEELRKKLDTVKAFVVRALAFPCQ